MVKIAGNLAQYLTIKLCARSCAKAKNVYMLLIIGERFCWANKLGWMTVQICREGSEYSKITPEENYEANFNIETLIELKDIL